MEGARIEVPGRVLLDGATLRLERGEHVVLVGPNGSGKTSLVETLCGQRQPAAGAVKVGHNVNLGYLSQHADTAAGAGTVLEAAQRGTGLSGQKVRDLLGHFLFSGREVDKQLSEISGGEQRRLSLAILVASGANVLILDEPTNHLDLESREALEDALRDYEGAVILISHDRALLEAVGTRTIAVEDGELRTYHTGWANYQRAQDEHEAQERDAERSARSAAKGAGAGQEGARSKPPGPSKNALRKVAKLETEIERAEVELKRLEDELADPSAWSSPGRSRRAGERHAEAKRSVEELYREWELASQEPA
jgi:ATP-binding cassette subfamily F protein 3